MIDYIFLWDNGYGDLFNSLYTPITMIYLMVFLFWGVKYLIETDKYYKSASLILLATLTPICHIPILIGFAFYGKSVIKKTIDEWKE